MQICGFVSVWKEGKEGHFKAWTRGVRLLMEDFLLPMSSWGCHPHQPIIKSSLGETPWELYEMCGLIQNGGGWSAWCPYPVWTSTTVCCPAWAVTASEQLTAVALGSLDRALSYWKANTRADCSSVTVQVNGRSVTKDPECKTDRQTEKMAPHFPPLPSAMEPSAVSWWHTKVPKWVGLAQNRKGRHTGTLILRSLGYPYTRQKHNNKKKASDQFPWWT